MGDRDGYSLRAPSSSSGGPLLPTIMSLVNSSSKDLTSVLRIARLASLHSQAAALSLLADLIWPDRQRRFACRLLVGEALQMDD